MANLELTPRGDGGFSISGSIEPGELTGAATSPATGDQPQPIPLGQETLARPQAGTEPASGTGGTVGNVAPLAPSDSGYVEPAAGTTETQGGTAPPATQP